MIRIKQNVVIGPNQEFYGHWYITRTVGKDVQYFHGGKWNSSLMDKDYKITGYFPHFVEAVRHAMEYKLNTDWISVG